MARYRKRNYRRSYRKSYRRRSYRKRRSNGIPGQIYAIGYFLAGLTGRMLMRGEAMTNPTMAKFETSLAGNIAGIGIPLGAAYLLKGKIKGLTTIMLGFSAPALVDVATDWAGKMKGA